MNASQRELKTALTIDKFRPKVDPVAVLSDWIHRVPLSDIAIKHLGYDERTSVGTRASAAHRYIRRMLRRLNIHIQKSLNEAISQVGVLLHYNERMEWGAVEPGLETHEEDIARRSDVVVEKSDNKPKRGTTRHTENHHHTFHGDYKILVLSDLHIPFHHRELIDMAISEHGDADELVLLGDIWDMYSVSRFQKEISIDLRTELQQSVEMFERLLNRFRRVVVVVGNHDIRAVKWIQKENPAMAPLVARPIDYVRSAMAVDGKHRLLDKLVTPTYLIKGSHSDYPVEVDYLYLVGDAVLGHFELSRKGPSATSYRLALEWLPQWLPLITDRNVRFLVQGHVHRLSKAVFGPYTLVESGCCAHVMGYSLRSPVYSSPGLGYVVLHQVDGKTDPNRSGYVMYDIYD